MMKGLLSDIVYINKSIPGPRPGRLRMPDLTPPPDVNLDDKFTMT